MALGPQSSPKVPNHRELTDLLSALELQLEAPLQDVAQVRSVIADANARLLTTFARLNTLIRSQQEQLRNLTGAPDEGSQEIGSLVASCIQSLQFEDIVRQILERTGADLHQLGTVMKSVRNAAYEEGGLASLATALLDEHRESASHRPRQQAVTAGEIEFF